MTQKAVTRIKEILDEKRSLDHAITLLHWDLETEAPTMGVNKIAKTIGYLSGESYSKVINEEFKKLIMGLNVEELTEIERKEIEEIKKEYFDKLDKIPKNDYEEYSKLTVIATKKWEEAKTNNNFEIFKDYLRQIINYNKKFIAYRNVGEKPYNILLDDYEKDITVDTLDVFFKKIKTDLSPFIKSILSVELEEEMKSKISIFNELSFDIEKQKQFSRYIAKLIGFDFDKGVIKESEHPFTLNFNNKDVRITTHYYEKNILSSIFSTIHEGGHAIYEQQIDDSISDTILGEGTSMGIHESQSRLFENMFGRNFNFWKGVYIKFDELFDVKSKGIEVSDFYKIINIVNKSLIRIEADELTYPIHIMIRYELEKEIFSNLEEIENTDYIDYLATKWADLYEEFLGIRPETYSDGILQDVHWSSGLFGYFPSYALGSAYAAQIYQAMNRNININESLLNTDFISINAFLKEKIHRFGKSKTPNEILFIATNEEFNSDYYINYLKDKYSKIYGLIVDRR